MHEPSGIIERSRARSRSARRGTEAGQWVGPRAHRRDEGGRRHRALADDGAEIGGVAVTVRDRDHHARTDGEGADALVSHDRQSGRLVVQRVGTVLEDQHDGNRAGCVTIHHQQPVLTHRNRVDRVARLGDLQTLGRRDRQEQVPAALFGGAVSDGEFRAVRLDLHAQGHRTVTQFLRVLSAVGDADFSCPAERGPVHLRVFGVVDAVGGLDAHFLAPARHVHLLVGFAGEGAFGAERVGNDEVKLPECVGRRSEAMVLAGNAIETHGVRQQAVRFVAKGEVSGIVAMQARPDRRAVVILPFRRGVGFPGISHAVVAGPRGLDRFNICIRRRDPGHIAEHQPVVDIAR